MLIIAILLFVAGVILPLLGAGMSWMWGLWVPAIVVVIISAATPKKPAGQKG